MADGQGIHLGERDCSLQRRHQNGSGKEAFSPGRSMLPERKRDRARSARSAIADLGYSRRRHDPSFLYEDGEFYFIEMNTRLQVGAPFSVTARPLQASI